MNQHFNSNQNQNRQKQQSSSYPLKIVALGGLDEMGKNCYIIEAGDDAFIIEAGMKYPSKAIPGVDTIIPDFTYVKTLGSKVKGIIITHGHDDQYGALPYLLNFCHAPVYASRTTIAIINSTYGKKFKRQISSATFIPVDPSGHAVIGSHNFEFFETTHSVSESFGFALKTKFGNIVYTSDYMTDYAPLKGYYFDLPKLARLSESEKTFLLLTESEAADKTGIASPAHKITDTLRRVLEEQSGKVFISLYSQNFYNIQEVINLAGKYQKKILIANPDQVSFFDDMARSGSIVIPQDMRISASDLIHTNSSDVIVLVTGGGEKLFKFIQDICYGMVKDLKIDTKDTFIDATPSVPGTEDIATITSDTVYRADCNVIALSRKTFASMHARQEDIKMMISLFHPRYYMPVKGEYRLLMANAMLAIGMGVGLNHFNTFVYDNGLALAFDEEGKAVRKVINVKAGDIMVDGYSVGDVKENSIAERQKMADGGVVIMGVNISSKLKKIVSQPDIQMRGFLYLKESEPILGQLSSLFLTNVNNFLASTGKKMAIQDLEYRISEKASKLLVRHTEKEPLVVVKILDVDRMEELDPR